MNAALSPPTTKLTGSLPPRPLNLKLSFEADVDQIWEADDRVDEDGEEADEAVDRLGHAEAGVEDSTPCNRG